MVATADSNCGQAVGFASPSANKCKGPHPAASVAMPPPAAFGRDFGQLLKSSSNRAAVSRGHLKRNSAALAAHANSGRVPVASIAPRQRISRMTARTVNAKRSPVPPISSSGGLDCPCRARPFSALTSSFIDGGLDCLCGVRPFSAQTSSFIDGGIDCPSGVRPFHAQNSSYIDGGLDCLCGVRHFSAQTSSFTDGGLDCPCGVRPFSALPSSSSARSSSPSPSARLQG
jgi:hypothetical protein